MIYDSTQIIRDDRDLRDIVKEIGGNVEGPRKAIFPKKPAIYGILVNKRDCLPIIQFKRSDFVYVGKAATHTGREHFKTGKTPGSTLRRTVGALLKEELGLCAFARGRGHSENDFSQYRFGESGEERLTEWMNANLQIGFSIVIDDIGGIEKRLISYCEPVLNLTGWAKPQAEKIKALRKMCVDETQANGPLRKP